MNVLNTHIRCMHQFGRKQVIAASVRSYYPNHYECWFIHDYYT